MKSQILAGGRGLGKFTNGFQGGVHIVHKDKVREQLTLRLLQHRVQTAKQMHYQEPIRPTISSSAPARAQAREVAEKMLGQTLVTKQTGPAGKPVNVLYVASKLSLEREMYFALLLDRQTAGAAFLPGTAAPLWQALGIVQPQRSL